MRIPHVALAFVLSACSPSGDHRDAHVAEDGGGDDAGEDAARPDTGPLRVACEASGTSCELGDYCERGTGRCHGPGRCLARPVECAEAIERVCGCDAVTYDSECEAHRAGTPVDHSGACG